MKLQLLQYIGEKPGPGHQVEISDSIELCIVELTRVDCILIWRLDYIINPLYSDGYSHTY